MTERFDDIIRDYIDFVNRQVGVYMDAMAGFAHIKVKVERQVHRATRPSHVTTNEKGERVVVWSSYEDPTKPDIVHNRIIPAEDYLIANSPGGSNEQQHSQAILVFLVAYWEHSIRKRLATAQGVEKTAIISNVMGDLTIARNCILHAKGRISPKEYKRIRVMTDILKPHQEIFVHYDEMHKVFYMIKQDMARLLFDWLGVTDGPIDPKDIRTLLFSASDLATELHFRF